ncbi:hypothetical protein DUNSADRAFT_8817, partial [Dunaliella salina]
MMGRVWSRQRLAPYLSFGKVLPGDSFDWPSDHKGASGICAGMSWRGGACLPTAGFHKTRHQHSHLQLQPLCGMSYKVPPPPGKSELAATLHSGEASIEDGTATCVRCRIPNISGADAEALSDNLLGMGAQSVVVQEHRPPGSVEQPIFDENPGSPDGPSNLWNSCEVVAYFGLE